jgi:hypothetical protein
MEVVLRQYISFLVRNLQNSLGRSSHQGVSRHEKYNVVLCLFAYRREYILDLAVAQDRRHMICKVRLG